MDSGYRAGMGSTFKEMRSSDQAVGKGEGLSLDRHPDGGGVWNSIQGGLREGSHKYLDIRTQVFFLVCYLPQGAGECALQTVQTLRTLRSGFLAGIRTRYV